MAQGQSHWWELSCLSRFYVKTYVTGLYIAGASRQLAITWANVYPDLHSNM